MRSGDSIKKQHCTQVTNRLQLAHKSMANDATSRMHMDNVKSVKDSVFRIQDGQVNPKPNPNLTLTLTP